MKVNISIDDICPHPKSSTRVLENCYRLIDNFADIKFTLFIPMAYTRLNEKSYCLRDYPEFCNVLKNLSPDHFELAWHGYLHGIKSISSNEEFRDLSSSCAMTVFRRMFKVAEDTGLIDKFKPIFRPPAFKISPESFVACKDKGIKILALSPHINNVISWRNRKIIYFDCMPPLYPLVKKDNLSIVYHASDWSPNLMDDRQTKELIEFLLFNKENGIDFVFMENF